MKKFRVVVAIIAAGAVLFFIFKSKNLPPQNVPGANETVSESGSNVSAATGKTPGTPKAPSPPVANVSSATDLASRAASPNQPPPQQGGAAANASEVPSLPPMTVLDNARVVMHNYRTTFGENPIGTNPEITAALMGKNPKQINFVSPESGLRVNEMGEMVDGYGTPFFFHQISGKEMEIHSAGPDKVMWTFDDVVTR